MRRDERRCRGCIKGDHCKSESVLDSNDCECECVAQATLDYLIAMAALAKAGGTTCLLVGGKGQLVVEEAGVHDVAILTEKGERLFTLPGHHVAQAGDMLDIDLTDLSASFV